MATLEGHPGPAWACRWLGDDRAVSVGGAGGGFAEARLWDLRHHHDRELVVPAALVDTLFTDLSERLAAIHLLEREAVEATARGLAG